MTKIETAKKAVGTAATILATVDGGGIGYKIGERISEFCYSAGSHLTTLDPFGPLFQYDSTGFDNAFVKAALLGTGALIALGLSVKCYGYLSKDSKTHGSAEKLNEV